MNFKGRLVPGRRERFCLWGAYGRTRWVGVEAWRREYAAGRAAGGTVGIGAHSVAAAWATVSANLDGLALAVLDLGEALGIDDRVPVSWEVERERFLQRLGVRNA